MSEDRLKYQIIDSLWTVVDRYDFIQSATLTGSFVNSNSLEGLSDIDFVVIVDKLDVDRYESLQRAFQTSLQPILQNAGYRLQINPNLGPLKFNEPKLAVLHLMFYSMEAHLDHVINSPFTCLDWQTSPVFRKQSIADIYPTFGLQPRHFVSARRSISDYLSDFKKSTVSFRELVCDKNGYTERKKGKPMDNRDRHEFAYHVMRFLMLNLLKLIRKYDQSVSQLATLMERFFSVFPEGEADARSLLSELAMKKRRVDYEHAIEDLSPRLEAFISSFERQFIECFATNASRHIVFRHAATVGNIGPVRFLGRSDLSILEQLDQASTTHLGNLCELMSSASISTAFVSPLKRCQQSMQLAIEDNLPVNIDERLIEMNYGQCEMMTTTDTRNRFPRLFEAWQREEDPRFPDGENSADVCNRVMNFAKERWQFDAPNSATCTHNAVLRSIVGELLGVPSAKRYRIRIPHLAPIEIVSTKKFGLYINLTENVEREIFGGFIGSPILLKCAG